MLRLGRSILIFYIGINYAYNELGLKVDTLKWVLLFVLLALTQILIFVSENNVNVKIKIKDEEE